MACDRPTGDDALFVGAGGPRPDAMCMPAADGVLILEPPTDPATFGTNALHCATIFESGCLRQQMLEAPLRALTPAPSPSGGSSVPWTRDGYVPPSFYGGATGRGGPGGTSEPFLRAESVLVVLLATPLDDCSTPTPEVFSASDPRYASVPSWMRCHIDPDPRYPVQRYVDGLVGLRRHASRVVLGAIAGLPRAIEALTPTEILADAAMQEHPDPHVPDALASACVGPDGSALPARRIVSVGEGIVAAGGHAVFMSGCDVNRFDFEQRLVDAIADAMAGAR